MELATRRKYIKAHSKTYTFYCFFYLVKNVQQRVVQMEAVVLQDLGSVVYFQVILKNETYYVENFWI